MALAAFRARDPGVRRETAGAYLKAAVIVIAPGEESQVDNGTGPMHITVRWVRTTVRMLTSGALHRYILRSHVVLTTLFPSTCMPL